MSEPEQTAVVSRRRLLTLARCFFHHRSLSFLTSPPEDEDSSEDTDASDEDDADVQADTDHEEEEEEADTVK